MKKFLKTFISVLLVCLMVFGSMLTVNNIDLPLKSIASASTTVSGCPNFTINGKTVNEKSVGYQGDNQCHLYAKKVYEIIWGFQFDSTHNGNQSTGWNMLRDLSSNERLNTAANAKKFISSAALGASIRIENNSGTSNDSWGHTLILVAKDSNGFTALEHWTSNQRGGVTQHYTWEQFASSSGNYSYYSYFKSIKWPNAPAFNNYTSAPNAPTLNVSSTSVNEGGSVTLTWNDVGNVTNYWIQGEDSNGNRVMGEIDNSRSRTLTLPVGTYSFVVIAINTVGKTNSNWVKFTVNSPHTHNYSTYSHYDTSHPHYSYYKCSCGATQIDYSENSYNSSCVWCNPSAFCADLGDVFYGVILNTACWKPISKTAEAREISLQTENGSSMQKWRFQRQSDGAYVITSCYDGTALEMTDGTRVTNGIRLTAKTEFSGENYQQWYLIPQGSGYIFLNKHYPSEQWVMDLSGNYTFDGNGIYSYPVNYSDGQIWSVYNREDVQLQPAKLSASVEGSKVTFTWPNVYGATSYSMKIFTEKMWKDSTGPYMTIGNVKSGESVELPAGKYYAYIDSEDYYSFIMSNVVTFEIAKATYTLAYDANGGTGAPSTQNGASSYMISSEQPIRSGYTFLGWSKSSTATYASYTAGDTITLSENTILFAVWQEEQNTENENTCSKCGESFEDETSYNKHISSCEAGGETGGGISFFSILLKILYFIIGLIALPFTLLF